MSEYGVDSFHIAVGQGDASIHLLVQLPADPTTKSTVIRACLLDGGNTCGGRPKPTYKGVGARGISRTMDHIKTKYNCPNGLRFDSIVVTHWDADHYKGIVELIKVDINSQTAAGKDPNTLLVSFMKYKDNIRATPETVFYAPEWWEKAAKDNPDASFYQDPTAMGYLGCKYTTSAAADKICLLNTGDIRGMNFLTNTPLPVKSPAKDIKSPLDLVTANPPEAGYPGIYCVCSNVKVLGTTTLDVVDHKSTDTNQSSICSMVIWQSGRVSHYFAGDASFDVEKMVSKWSGMDGSAGKKLFAMKLSHHGDAGTSPVETLNSYNPDYIVISAGTKYQHPRWELILYLAAWLQTNRARPGEKCVFSTEYPTYLIKNTAGKFTDFGSGNTKSASFPDKDKGSVEVKQFLADLQTVYTKINAGAAAAGKPQQNIYDTYLAWLAKNSPQSDAGRIGWIYEQLTNSWETISPITSTAHVAVSAAAVGPTAAILSGKGLVDYIRVACRNTSPEGIFIKYDNEPDDHRLSPVPAVIPAPTAAKTSTVENSGEPVKKKARVDTGPPINNGSFAVGPDVDMNEGDPIVIDSPIDMTLEKATKSLGNDILVTGTGFYFYCSQIQATGTNVRILSAGDMDDFVTVLRHGVVCLKAQPAVGSPSEFLDSDEWLCWFIDCIGATSLSATGDENGNMDGFSLTMTPPANSTQPPQADGEKDLLFNTSSVIFAFDPISDMPGFLDPPGGSTDDPIPGLLGPVDTVVFGLDPTSPVLTMALRDLFTYVGLPMLADSTPLGDTVLTLDPAKSKGHRNAVWFDPRTRYRTVVRLQFEIQGLDSLKGYLSFLTDFVIVDASVIGKKTSSWIMGPTGVSITSIAEVTLTMNCTVNKVEFQAAITCQPDLVTLELTTLSLNALEGILAWLATLVGVTEWDFTSWLGTAGSSFNTPQFRRISLALTTGAKPTVEHFSMDMEIALNFGGGGNEPALFLFTYNWKKGQKFGALKAALWCKPPAVAILPFRKLLPAWEDYLVFEPITVPQPSETLDLSKMIPDGSGVSNIPNGIPTNICQASIEIDDTAIVFAGALTCTEPPASGLPTIYLGKVFVNASYTFGNPGTFDLSLRVQTLIKGQAGSAFEPDAVLYGTVQYESGNWHLSASLQDLYASTLYSFFDSDSRDGVMTFLERLSIRELSLQYNYLKEGGASDFTFKGIIFLGRLELDLNFVYNSDGWTFNAALGATSTESSTIAEIVESIIGPTDDLPPFVGNIKVDPTVAGGLININCEKISGGLFFSASVHIGILEFTFAQFRDAGWEASVAPKRVFKVSVMELPAVDVPLVGNLTQPFDEMFYLWVQDNSGKNDPGKSPGITRAEFASINAQLKGDQLAFKETVDPKKQAPSDVVIGVGSHFVLILKGEKGELNVVIDYLFNAPSKDKEFELTETGDESPPSDSALAPYKKSIGPLTISNIGFHYKDHTLSVLVDAGFLLGPVGFTLMGFSLNIAFGDSFTIQDFPDLSFSLAGLAVSFNRPPIVITGLYKHVTTPTIDYYAGGVIVAFDPYLFEAAGFYGTTLGPNGFESVFVFAKLDGPLVTLEFAEISGITGGFGYNVELEFPSVSQVYEFPLLTIQPTPGSSPMDTLIQLTAPGVWFNPRDGSFWIAAGLKVTAFETLAIDAVVVVEWNPYVKLGLFGIAVADVPAGAEEKFLHVELGISATVDFNAGVMKFEAQLSPNSYILSPSCHLTGGFALYYWFKGSDPQLEGDWVFTIGGYHQAFIPPSQYPTPPRLGISWNLDDHLSITGESYFAITPKVCMGGGRLHAALSLGLLYAYLDAYADFLINYKPFHFIADGGVTVGVRFTLDLWIVTIHINLELGAQLYLEGPPMSGKVHVDFWVFGFDVNFGPGAPGPTPVDLDTFYELVFQSGTPTSLSGTNFFLPSGDVNDSDDPPPAKPFVFGCQSGLITGSGSQETPPGTPWAVRAGSFSFAISCRFAIGTATLNTNPPISQQTAIYAKPMQLINPLTSTMIITIGPDAGETLSEEPVWKIEQAVKSVPNALWGIYNPAEDPALNGNNIASLLDSGGVATPLMMGVTISAPDPVLSNDVIPKFNAAAAMAEDVFPPPEPSKLFPDSTTEAKASWLPLKPGPNPWADVSNAWANPKMGAASQQNTVDLWTSAFFWEKLSGSVPPILLKDFNDLYLAAPLLSEIS